MRKQAKNMKMTEPKIVFLTNSLTGGGAERAINALINELHANLQNIFLVTVKESQEDLVKVLPDVFCLTKGKRWNFLKFIQAILRFQVFMRKHKVNYLILNCALPELIGSLILGSQKLIVVEHASQPWPRKKFLGMLVRRLLILRHSKWVGVSEHLSVWGTQNDIDAFIPNAIGYDLNVPMNQSPSTGTIKRLVFIGRLSPEKNPINALRVSHELNLPVVLIGNGILESTLRNYCQQNNIECEFKGFLEDPWLEIKTGDLLLIPSLNEGDGLVVIEALYHNMPFLLSNIPAFGRFLFPEKHYCNSVSEYVSKIQFYQTRIEELRVSNVVRSEIVGARTPGLIAESWIDFLQNNT